MIYTGTTQELVNDVFDRLNVRIGNCADYKVTMNDGEITIWVGVDSLRWMNPIDEVTSAFNTIFTNIGVGTKIINGNYVKVNCSLCDINIRR